MVGTIEYKVLILPGKRWRIQRGDAYVTSWCFPEVMITSARSSYASILACLCRERMEGKLSSSKILLGYDWTPDCWGWRKEELM